MTTEKKAWGRAERHHKLQVDWPAPLGPVPGAKREQLLFSGAHTGREGYLKFFLNSFLCHMGILYAWDMGMICYVCECGHALGEVRGQLRVLSSPASLFQVGTLALNESTQELLGSFCLCLPFCHGSPGIIDTLGGVCLLHVFVRFELRSSFLLKGCFAHWAISPAYVKHLEIKGRGVTVTLRHNMSGLR